MNNSKKSNELNESKMQKEVSKNIYPNYISFLQTNRTKEQAEEIFNQRIKDSKEVFNKFSLSFSERVCPTCGNSESKELTPFHDSYGVVQCNFCLTNYVNPCPSLEALNYYYNECSCNALLGSLLRSRHGKSNHILSERTDFILKLLKEHFLDKGSIKILEIGCNSGIFLSELKDAVAISMPDKKFHFYGIDIDRSAIEQNVDAEIMLEATSVEEYAVTKSEKFDLILHFELIEHLENPFSFMKSVRLIMADNGLHHFHTPNANGFDNMAIGYNDFRPLAHGIFPPMHLQAFTPHNILHFALRSEFKLLQIDTPGGFDVDIVRNFLSNPEESKFRYIKEIPSEYLAVFQEWLKVLGASSHMRVTLKA